MDHAQARCTCVAVATLWLGSASDGLYAQANAENVGGSINLGARGAIALQAPSQPAPTQDHPDSPVEFSFRAGIASDYIYRGTTLSAHKLAAGAAFEAARGIFYGGSTHRQCQAPEPAGRGDFAERRRSSEAGGRAIRLRRDLLCLSGRDAPDRCDQGHRLLGGLARADTTLRECCVSPAASPIRRMSPTPAPGASMRRSAWGSTCRAPLLPQDVSASVTGGVGYSWFGNQSAALGGFPLPAYLNWNAGVTFTYKKLNLDLRYYDTNLSKENCFVFTGDPDAAPGGHPNLTNPAGLVSQWCSAAFVAKYFIAFD